jgi:hypothetical protein
MEKTPYKFVCLNDMRFSEGREDVEDDEPPCCLVMTKTDENVEK